MATSKLKILLPQDKNLSRLLDQVNGPAISGTVTVTIEALDKMRRDHEAALAIAHELVAKQGTIKIVVTERTDSVRYERSYVATEPGKYVSDPHYQEVSVSYVNLETVQSKLQEEEEQKVAQIIEDLRSSEERAKQETQKITSHLTDITKIKNELYEDGVQLRKTNEELTKELEKANTAHDDLLEKTDKEIAEFEKTIEEHEATIVKLNGLRSDESLFGLIRKWFKL